MRGEHADARRALLKVIRHEFWLIHGRIEGLNPREMVAVPGHPGTLLRYLDLIADERAGERTVKVTLNEGSPNEERVNWPLGELLNGVESEAERQRAQEREEGQGRIIYYDQRDQSVNVRDVIDGQVANEMEGAIIEAGRSAHAPLGAADSTEAGKSAHGTSGQAAFSEKSKHQRQPTSIPMNIDKSIKTGNVTGSQIGIEIIGSTNNYTVQAAPEVKTLLEDLTKEMTAVIERLPEDKQEEAAKDLKMLTEEATSGKPSRKWYTVSSEGLIEAAEFVGEFSEKIGNSIGKIGGAVGQAATLGTADSIRGLIDKLTEKLWP